MKFKLATAAAAVLMSATASQAADLAKKAPVAVDYVKVCDAYGAGFFYIPGTETCLKIGGYLRTEVLAGSVDFLGSSTDEAGGSSLYDDDSREANDYITRARILLSADARTATDFGVLRSFGAVYGTINSGSSTGSFDVDKAFIQWGGLTAGYATSAWDFFTGFTPQRYFGADEYDQTKNLLSYTFGFGNGLSATLSVEDQTVEAGRVGSNYGGNHLPDFIAKLNLAQAWGSAQIMGVAHENYGDDDVDDEKMGYAFGAGVIVNLPMLGAGDQIALQGVWSKGALAYASSSLAYEAGAYDFTDSMSQSEAWSVSGGFRHVFAPTLMANIDASYASVDLAATNDDFDQTFVAASVTWAPYGGVTGSPSIALTGFVEYRSIDFDLGGDADGFVGGLRLQRNF